MFCPSQESIHRPWDLKSLLWNAKPTVCVNAFLSSRVYLYFCTWATAGRQFTYNLSYALVPRVCRCDTMQKVLDQSKKHRDYCCSMIVNDKNSEWKSQHIRRNNKVEKIKAPEKLLFSIFWKIQIPYFWELWPLKCNSGSVPGGDQDSFPLGIQSHFSCCPHPTGPTSQSLRRHNSSTMSGFLQAQALDRR